jgi:hypothetical protein
VAIATVFHNALTGSLLDSAITLQVKGSEYAAVLVIIALAIASIADILYLGVRERAAELAALRATGWTNVALARLGRPRGRGWGSSTRSRVRESGSLRPRRSLALFRAG